MTSWSYNLAFDITFSLSWKSAGETLEFISKRESLLKVPLMLEAQMKSAYLTVKMHRLPASLTVPISDDSLPFPVTNF